MNFKFIISICLFLFAAQPSHGEELCEPDLRSEAGSPRWTWQDTTKEILITPVPQEFLDDLQKNGAAVVTLGGSTVSFLVPELGRAEKAAYMGPPKTMDELTQILADAATPALKNLARSRRILSGRPPVLIVPAPGLAVGDETVILPGNFGALGNKAYRLKELLRAELAKRARETGIPADLLSQTNIFVTNDSFPVIAQAAAALRENEQATIVFGGTGLGSGKIIKYAGNEFAMISAEESHELLSRFSAIRAKVPECILLGAEIAHTHVTLENISGGGRVMSDGARTHLGGATSVALSFFLNEEEVPKWIKDRAPNWRAVRARGLRSLGFNSEQEVSALLRESAPDRALISAVRTHGSVNLKDLALAARQGSWLAKILMRHSVYTQGLVGGVLLMKFGVSPAKVSPPLETPIEFTFGPVRSGPRVLKLLVRVSEALSGWEGESLADAQRGVEDAVGTQLSSRSYQRELSLRGYTLKPGDIRVHIEAIRPDGTLHPDFWGMGPFTNSERFKSDYEDELMKAIESIKSGMPAKKQ